MPKPEITVGTQGVGISVPISTELAEIIRTVPDYERHVKQLRKWFKNKRQVNVKVCCYTLQTTIPLLQGVFHSLREPKPDITISILRPDLSRPLAIWDAEKAEDRLYWQMKQQEATLGQRVLKDAAEQFPGLRIKEFMFPFDPSIKAIIVNDTYALFGLYAIRDNIKGNPPVQSKDYIGTDTRLIKLSSHRWGQNAEFDTVLTWFNRTWRWLEEVR